ncbi:hypothetical protein [Pseudomonas fulva]|uniref:hypothetical protein n=1 Tax=Pseudomonas fulva TaxID=47880 RepID=UPI0015E308FC|nr:hypothetical protein [Pseudomonas fulva]MBA1209635.1 hypothetical protein [Pseudomonas fulva]MBA1217734.1 hypothetical protein [Pseudomonas fulva]MDH0573213.1 hypothetical protein [Pseudomonas fulva]
MRLKPRLLPDLTSMAGLGDRARRESTALEGKTMAKRPTNRIKYKIWGEDSSTEFDGSIAEGLYYGAWSLSVVDRQQLIDRLIEQQKKVLSQSPCVTSA